MAPIPSSANVCNTGFSNAKIGGNGFMGASFRKALFNRPNIRFGKFGRWVGGASVTDSWMPALINFIHSIVIVATKPKVVRVDATGVIAGMANMKVASLANKVFIGLPVGKARRFLIAIPHLRVASSIFASLPHPAAAFKNFIACLKAGKIIHIHKNSSLGYAQYIGNGGKRGR